MFAVNASIDINDTNSNRVEENKTISKVASEYHETLNHVLNNKNMMEDRCTVYISKIIFET